MCWSRHSRGYSGQDPLQNREVAESEHGHITAQWPSGARGERGKWGHVCSALVSRGASSRSQGKAEKEAKKLTEATDPSLCCSSSVDDS